MASTPFYTLNYTASGTTYSTFLTGIRGDSIVGAFVDTNGLEQGLLYDRQFGLWTSISYPAAVSTVPYGPSFGSYAAGLDIVGSYKLSGEMTDHGFLFESSASPDAQWVPLDYPGATNTIPHSTFNGLVVGNWDVFPNANPDFDSYPYAGNAFIYDIAAATFAVNDKPDALSTTAYGIWDGMIAGGYADTPAIGGIQPTHGYIYDMAADIWHTYDHPGAVITHFDGISGGGAPGAFILTGDWLGVAEGTGSPEHAFVLRVQDWNVLEWIDVSITGSAATSGNSVYGDTVIGVYTTDPSTGINGYVATIPCFASGTRIATPAGAVAVEHLHPGMLVLTVTGEAVAIQWLGRRMVACRHHPAPKTVWPVRVSAGAFDDRLPEHDLWLSPDHAIYAHEMLIPVKHLINGTTIVQVESDEITYWHVELPRHDVILAEGLPVESYLETGGRSSFANGGDVVTLFPDFSSRVWEAEGYAPLLVTGAALAAVQHRIAARHVAPSRRRRAV